MLCRTAKDSFNGLVPLTALTCPNFLIWPDLALKVIAGSLNPILGGV